MFQKSLTFLAALSLVVALILPRPDRDNIDSIEYVEKTQQIGASYSFVVCPKKDFNCLSDEVQLRSYCGQVMRYSWNAHLHVNLLYHECMHKNGVDVEIYAKIGEMLSFQSEQ